MSELRGRPFAYVALMLSLWVGARWVTPDRHIGPSITLPPLRASNHNTRVMPPDTAAPKFADSAAIEPQRPKLVLRTIRPRDGRIISPHSTKFGLPPAYDPWQEGGRPSGLFAPLRLVLEDSEPQITGRDTPPTIALAPAGKAGTPLTIRQARADVYAYSFWRFSTGATAALAPGAQYGGSQTGIVATIDPFGAPNTGLALLVRGTSTPDGKERELAMGLRWKPDTKWPLWISAEKRFQTDSADRFAVYASGGFDTVPIIGQWRLDAFGQAGFASGRSGGGFFDAQTRVMRPLGVIGGVPFSVGVGGWSGGQRDAARVDAGPTVKATIDTGLAAVLVTADWRLRVAGNAKPKHGLALTVSSTF